MIFWMLNWIGMLSVYVICHFANEAAIIRLIIPFPLSGLALESLITLLTPKFIPFFMLLWIICELLLLQRLQVLLTTPRLLIPPDTFSSCSGLLFTRCPNTFTLESAMTGDVSVCIFPIDILPRIYHYGYAAPFYNISNSIRSIVFGTKNTCKSFLISCSHSRSSMRLTHNHLHASGIKLRRALCLGRRVVHNTTNSPMVCPTE